MSAGSVLPESAMQHTTSPADIPAATPILMQPVFNQSSLLPPCTQPQSTNAAPVQPHCFQQQSTPSTPNLWLLEISLILCVMWRKQHKLYYHRVLQTWCYVCCVLCSDSARQNLLTSRVAVVEVGRWNQDLAARCAWPTRRSCDEEGTTKGKTTQSFWALVWSSQSKRIWTSKHRISMYEWQTVAFTVCPSPWQHIKSSTDCIWKCEPFIQAIAVKLF